MISPDHIRNQLVGLWAMAFNRPDWEQKLDRSSTAIIASFWAIIPTFTITVLGAIYAEPVMLEVAKTMDSMKDAAIAPLVPRVLMSSLAFFFGWFLSLGMLIRIARRLEGEAAMGDMIVGYNWLQIPFRLCAFFPILVFLITGSGQLMSVLSLPLIVLSIAMLWGVLRRALPRTNWTVIVGILICLAIVTLLSSIIAGSIGGLFYTASPVSGSAVSR